MCFFKTLCFFALQGIQATQEQMRLAQIISDPRTEDNKMVEEKVKQVRIKEKA